MASDATIVEVLRPPAGRLPFLLILRTFGNPVASWAQDIYDEPVVVYRTFGLETVFVMDPELIQQVLLDDAEHFTKNPQGLGSSLERSIDLSPRRRAARCRSAGCSH